MLNYKYHAENNFPPHISLEAQKCQMNLLSHASAEILPTHNNAPLLMLLYPLYIDLHFIYSIFQYNIYTHIFLNILLMILSSRPIHRIAN